MKLQKRARLMLTAVAILGIVGGAMAFKAQRFGGGSIWTYYTTTVLSGVEYPLCSFRNNLTTTNAGALTTIYTTNTTVGTQTNVCTFPLETFTKATIPGI